MKINRKIISFFIVSFLMFSTSIYSVFGQSTDDINYTFRDDVLYNNSSLGLLNEFNNTYNSRNKGIYTEIYNGTYSFTNEVGLINTDILFVDNIGAAYTAIVLDSFQNHKEVLKVSRNGAFSDFPINNINNQIIGTIEFWMNSDSTGVDVSQLTGVDIGSNLMFIVEYLNESSILQITHGDGIGGNIEVDTIVDNWAHVRIDFDCITDSFSGFVNYIEVVSNENFFNDNTVSSLTNVRLSQANGVSGYYDAISYNWFAHDNGIPTFDFESDTIGNLPNNWNEFNNTGQTTVVSKDGSQQFNGHSTFDGGFIWWLYTNSTQIFNSGSQLFGTIQFDFIIDVAPTDSITIVFERNEIAVFFLNFVHIAGVLRLQASNPGSTTIANIVVNQTYHLLIDFRNGLAPSFRNLDIKTYDVYLNGFLLANGFINNVNEGLTNIRVQTDESFFDTKDIWLDNLDYSWNTTRTTLRYNIGQNLIPFLEVSQSIIVVDKFEFDYKTNDFKELKDIGTNDDLSSWSLVNEVSESLVFIDNNINKENSREIRISHLGATANILGIEKNFTSHTNILNISWSIMFHDFGQINEFKMRVFSFDNTLVSDIFFQNFSLRYNIGGGDFETLQSGLGDEIYDLNLYINYKDNLSILRFSIEGVFQDFFSIPLIESGKEGLRRIQIFNDGIVGKSTTVGIDSIGIYFNGISQSIENGFLEPYIITSSFYQAVQWNLFTFEGSGNISFHVNNFGLHRDFGNTFSELRDIINYSGITSFSVYDSLKFVFVNPFIRMFFFNDITVSSLKISGVKLSDGFIEGFPLVLNSGIDSEVNYFFVDSEGKFQFIHEANDTNIEFMTAIFFDFTEFSTNQRSLSFTSQKNDIANGFLQISFLDDTSNIIEIPSFLRTTNVILTQNKTFNTLIITITDNDIDSINGITIGYISDLQIGFGVNFLVSVITLSLLLIIAPLLIILLPTMIIGGRLGKQFFVPMFFIMSLICGITGIIPIWLFFIIAISTTIFIVKNRDREMI